ncbi:L,D-transpeptidase catalytic domain protein, partial [Vibrio harveyi]
MYLMDNGEVVKEYRIALGANPKGHKQEEGDNRTPEGDYTLDYV